MRRALIVALLGLVFVVAGLVAAAAWLLYTESGLQWAYAQARSRSPGELTAESLTGRLAGPLEVHGLRYRDGETAVQLESARLEWAPAALLYARLSIQELSLQGLRVELPKREELPAPKEPLRVPRLPLTLDIDQAQLHDLVVVRETETLLAVHAVNIQDARLGPQVLSLTRLFVDADRFSLDASGGLALEGDDETLTVSWRVDPTGVPRIAGHGTLTGTLSRLKLEQTVTAPADVALKAEIRDALRKPWWTAEVSAPSLDPRQIKKDWPSVPLNLDASLKGDATSFGATGRAQLRYAGQTLHTEFVIEGDAEALVAKRIELRRPGAPGVVRAQGRWAVAEQSFVLAGHWQSLQWPLTGDAVVTSPEGTVEIEGRVDDYRVSLTTRTEASSLPPGRWRLEGKGNRKGLTAQAIEGDVLEGRVSGDAQLAWAPRLSWSARVGAEGINPGAQWPEWPGKLRVKAQAQGTPAEIKLTLDTLAGTLRDYPVRARGSVVRRGDSYPELRLQAESKGTQVRVSGSVKREWNLAWQATARDLHVLLPEASGRVTASGRVDGPRATPLLTAELKGRAVAHDGRSAQSLALNARIDLSEREPSSLTLDGQDLIVDGREIQRVRVRAQGQIRDHEVAAHATLPDLRADLRFMGGYAARAWQGRLQGATIIGPPAAGTWNLKQPAPLAVRRDRLALGETCLSRGRPDVCLSVDWTSGAAGKLSASADALPLALFAPLLPNSVEVQATVSGKGEALLDQGRVRTAHAHIDLSSGTIVLGPPGTGTSTIALQGGDARLTIDDHGLQAQAQARLAGQDYARLELRLPEYGGLRPAGPQQPLAGRIVGRIQDLTPVAPLVPELSRLTGAVRADLRIAGTLSDPELRGEIALVDAGARITALGIRVEDVQLTASAVKNDVLTLSGRARSGKGLLELSGTVALEPQQAWRAQLRLTGERFEAVDVREARILVSPDLRLDVVPRRVGIAGTVRIPEAQLMPRPRLRGPEVVPVSRDVVIVNAPEDETRPAPTQPWTVTGQVEVILGEEVKFEGFGLTGLIEGQLTLIEQPGKFTTGRGELRIEDGKYEAFGQKLDIERGRLLFAGGPVDNPGIDARAVRKLEEVTAGMTVKGTLRSPQLSIFSDPAMGQADALSYLLFGQPLEASSTSQGRTLAGAAAALQLTGGEFLAKRLAAQFGIEDVSIESREDKTTGAEEAALVLGTQLSPRLYVNYSIGLFEQANIFRIRYKLGRRWALQAESGQDVGADLLYTIER